MANLEDVFRVSGVPTYTYVTPDRYGEIKVAIRTPGRCVVLEGPSGIGKTTVVAKALEELSLDASPTLLSGRKVGDVEIIADLPNMANFGTVVVDDFHRLSDLIKGSLSDYLKILAESDNQTDKIILIGINKAGDQLVKYGRDLGLRIDIFGLEANSPEKILQLISLGENALNVSIEQKEVIAERAQGSFQTAQLLCHKICAKEDITETSDVRRCIPTPIEGVIDDAMADLSRQFRDATLAFARGTKIKREGKAPYLHILKWLSESDDGSVDLTEAMNAHPDQKQSVGQVVKKDFLVTLLSDTEKRELFDPIIFYDKETTIFGAEDPKFLFYLRNLGWRAFTRQCGFAGDFFAGRYDYALSFAGSERSTVEKVAELLREREIGVFMIFMNNIKFSAPM